MMRMVRVAVAYINKKILAVANCFSSLEKKMIDLQYLKLLWMTCTISFHKKNNKASASTVCKLSTNPAVLLKALLKFIKKL